MKIYSERRSIFLAKFFLCQVGLRQCGYDECVAPQDKGDHYLVAHLVSRSCGETVWCKVPIGHIPRSYDVHHMARRGRHYLDESTWLAVSRANHRLIENNPSWARTHGYLK